MRRSTSWGRHVVVVLAGLGLALAQIWTRLQVVSVGYALSDTRQLIQRLEEEQQALEVEWSARTAPWRLAARATQQLGLRAPQPEQVIRVP